MAWPSYRAQCSRAETVPAVWVPAAPLYECLHYGATRSALFPSSRSHPASRPRGFAVRAHAGRLLPRQPAAQLHRRPAVARGWHHLPDPQSYPLQVAWGWLPSRRWQHWWALQQAGATLRAPPVVCTPSPAPSWPSTPLGHRFGLRGWCGSASPTSPGPTRAAPTPVDKTPRSARTPSVDQPVGAPPQSAPAPHPHPVGALGLMRGHTRLS